MDTDARGFPLGDLRVSDAERDRAVSELSEAFEAGRITLEEFDRRSTRALSARTGRELTATVADLPLDLGRVDDAAADTATPRQVDSYLVPRLSFAASLTAICFASDAVSSASQPGVGWIGALTPAVVSVLCLILVIILRVRAARLSERHPPREIPWRARRAAVRASGAVWEHHRGPATPPGEKSAGLGGASVRSSSWVLVFNRGSLPQ
jgi:hypothetical protein